MESVKSSSLCGVRTNMSATFLRTSTNKRVDNVLMEPINELILDNGRQEAVWSLGVDNEEVELVGTLPYKSVQPREGDVVPRGGMSQCFESFEISVRRFVEFYHGALRENSFVYSPVLARLYEIVDVLG